MANTALGELTRSTALKLVEIAVAVALAGGAVYLLAEFGPEVLELMFDAFQESRQSDADVEPTQDEYEGQDSDEWDDDEMDAEDEGEGQAW